MLVQILFTTSDKELDYYNQKVNKKTRFASRVAKQLKTQDFSMLGNSKEIPEILRIDRKVFSLKILS